MDEHLAEAERLWRESDTRGALQRYDLALELARGAGNTDKEGMILLGKGFAILNAQDQETREDEALRREAKECLQAAKVLAQEQGKIDAAAFVQQLLDRNGLMPSTHSCEDHGKCDEKSGDNCSDHATVIRAVAEKADIVRRRRRVEVGVAEKPEGRELREDGTEALWTQAADEALITCVAREGPGNWDEKALALFASELEHSSTCLDSESGLSKSDAATETGKSAPKSAAAFQNMSGDDLRRRWDYLLPFVREEFHTNPDAMTKKRACGHSCGTCPTRKSCHLHDAVADIEDMVS